MATVCFQGELGAFSEEACFRYFPNTVTSRACRDLKDVFRELSDGRCEYAVVPAENSLEGTITETYDLLLASDLKISGEVILRVSHSLIALPGVRLEDIKTIYSHPQAIAQCRKFITSIKAITYSTYDTAGSVKMIKEQGIVDAAAIASERAAQIYQMSVLKTEIEDSQSNYTRFFVLSKKDAKPTGNDKTSIIFGLRHVPGALYSALEIFATRSINLTKIESRPTREKPWEYNFFLDFEGHHMDQKCKGALQRLASSTVFLKILGSYPSAN